jgi:hypothetical protein
MTPRTSIPSCVLIQEPPFGEQKCHLFGWSHAPLLVFVLFCLFVCRCMAVVCMCESLKAMGWREHAIRKPKNKRKKKRVTIRPDALSLSPPPPSFSPPPQKKTNKQKHTHTHKHTHISPPPKHTQQSSTHRHRGSWHWITSEFAALGSNETKLGSVQLAGGPRGTPIPAEPVSTRTSMICGGGGG